MKTARSPRKSHVRIFHESTSLGIRVSFRHDIEGRSPTANDTDVAQEYDLAAREAGGQTVAVGRLALLPHTNTARFADELMTLPTNLGGLVIYISALGGSTLPTAAFNTIGLAFAGNLFSTLPAFSTVP